MSQRVAILISGGGSNMEALVRSMTGDHPARACIVISNVVGAGGLDRAKALGVPALSVPHKGRTRSEFEHALADSLDAAQPDLIALAGFMRILSPGFVARYEGRMLNIHPSLLPKYPGLNTHARALEAGDTEAGTTVHRVTAELDAGPILGQARVPILPSDTADSLAARILIQEHKLYPAVLRRVAEGNPDPVYLP